MFVLCHCVRLVCCNYIFGSSCESPANVGQTCNSRDATGDIIDSVRHFARCILMQSQSKCKEECTRTFRLFLTPFVECYACATFAHDSKFIPNEPIKRHKHK